MKYEEVVDISLINFHPKSLDKISLINEMSNLLYAKERINDIDAFIESIKEREKIASTDMGIGVAIPHGKGSFVQKSSIVIFRSDSGIKWEEDPVKAIILLAVDDDQEGKTHLEIIAKVSTMLIDDDFLDMLFNTKLEKDLYNEIIKRLKEQQ